MDINLFILFKTSFEMSMVSSLKYASGDVSSKVKVYLTANNTCEYILNLLNSDYNDEDLNNLKLAFLEIDSCFTDIYNINPTIRIRLDNKD